MRGGGFSVVGRVSWSVLWPVMLAWALTLTGCATVATPAQREAQADALADARGWRRQSLQAGAFELVSYGPRELTRDSRLTVYLEGDGFAWRDGSTPSRDPTPLNPVGLRLALAQAEDNAVYLARPCQYVDARYSGCLQRYWTTARFAEEVVAATNIAVETLKTRHGADRLVLVGFSGGAAVAALVASRRQDVERLVTVAGNLDHHAWTAFHRVDPLVDSLNAADVAGQLKELPQIHFVGRDDSVIPPVLARAWPVGFVGDGGQNLRVVAGQGHGCCWPDVWADLQDGLQSGGNVVE